MDYCDVAIVGAGPYGLSIAAHLRGSGVRFRIFGSPMHTWREHMPDGMVLKSDGFASNLSDPTSAFTLKRFCDERGIAYDDMTIPVLVETLRAYGVAFQERMVPELEDTQVTRVARYSGGFRLELASGGTATARSVVIAVGITHFTVIPATLEHLPSELVTHSSNHRSLERFRGRSVTVIGAGASAIDLAVLLKDVGTDVVLVARRPALRFNTPPAKRRTLWDKVRRPSSTIGPGWRSLFYAEAPGLFYRLPESTRSRIVSTFLGPAAGWPMKERFVGRVPTYLGHDIEKAEVRQGLVCLTLNAAGARREHLTEHVITATGYRVDVRRLTFLSDDIQTALRVNQDVPVLSAQFETSLPGMYFVGMASKHSFGPVMQFACGARWTARRISRRLAEMCLPPHASASSDVVEPSRTVS